MILLGDIGIVKQCSSSWHGVSAWDLFDTHDHSLIDIAKYKELLFRAAYEVFQPLGVPKSVMKNWFYGNANYLVAPGWLHPRMELPLFADMKHLRVDTIR